MASLAPPSTLNHRTPIQPSVDPRTDPKLHIPPWHNRDLAASSSACPSSTASPVPTLHIPRDNKKLLYSPNPPFCTVHISNLCIYHRFLCLPRTHFHLCAVHFSYFPSNLLEHSHHFCFRHFYFLQRYFHRYLRVLNNERRRNILISQLPHQETPVPGAKNLSLAFSMTISVKRVSEPSA